MYLYNEDIHLVFFKQKRKIENQLSQQKYKNKDSGKLISQYYSGCQGYL